MPKNLKLRVRVQNELDSIWKGQGLNLKTKLPVGVSSHKKKKFFEKVEELEKLRAKALSKQELQLSLRTKPNKSKKTLKLEASRKLLMKAQRANNNTPLPITVLAIALGENANFLRALVRSNLLKPIGSIEYKASVNLRFPTYTMDSVRKQLGDPIVQEKIRKKFANYGEAVKTTLEERLRAYRND